MFKRWNNGHWWGRGKHAIKYTKVKDRFQWHEHGTFKNWLCVVHSKQSPMVPWNSEKLKLKSQKNCKIGMGSNEQLEVNLELWSLED